MTVRPAEVVLIRLVFHRTPGGKARSAEVLLDTGDDDFIAAPITSQQRHTEFDVAVRQVAGGGTKRGFDHPSSQAYLYWQKMRSCGTSVN